MTVVANALRIGGVLSVGYGLWLWSPSLTFIFAGLVATGSARWMYNQFSAKRSNA